MRISDWSSDVCSSDLSLDPDRFAFITRWGRLDQVLRGVEAAKAAGLAVRITMVALKGVNDEELVGMARWCGEERFDLPLIATMPMGSVDDDRVARYLQLRETRGILARGFTPRPADTRTGDTARDWTR